MKNEEQLKASADACIDRALKECVKVERDLKELKYGAPRAKIMPRLRCEVAEISKNIHEFNAYINATNT